MSSEVQLVSPCVGVCTQDPVTGICQGCLRTTEEIAAWPRLAYADQMALLDRLHERRAAAGMPARRRTQRRRRVQSPAG